MLSTDKPTPSPSDRVLSATLLQVHGRRRRRRRQVAATASLVTIVVVGISTFFGEHPSSPTAPRPEPSASPPIAIAEAEVETEAESAGVSIQRITALDGSSIDSSRIQRSTRLGTIERLSAHSQSSRLVESISEGQLFAALPEEQPAALLKNPDGSSRLFLLKKMRSTH